MAYRFRSDESVREAFARCASEQLDRAVSELSEHIGDDPVHAVHSARKAVKKERSLLRLMRGSMPSTQRRRENRRLRKAARGLSAARDAEVMIDTLDELAKRYVGQLPENTFEGIREPLVRTRDEQRAQLIDSTLGDQAVGGLGAVRLRVDDWRLADGGWAAIEDGLLRSYTSGRAAFARAQSHRDMDEWHEWRKRVKDLWYQQRLLSAVGGPMVKGQAKDADVLADLLGDDHDLGVLRRSLAAGAIHAPVDVDAVIALIDHRRGELQSEALWIGARVYAEKPKAFRRRMRRSWKAGRGRAAATTHAHPLELAGATRAPGQA
jgi:CHAD domain-containing protein